MNYHIYVLKNNNTPFYVGITTKSYIDLFDYYSTAISENKKTIGKELFSRLKKAIDFNHFDIEMAMVRGSKEIAYKCKTELINKLVKNNILLSIIINL